MDFDLTEFSGGRSYKLVTSTIVPRPIAWIVSKNNQGDLNAAPFSFFNAFSGDPAIICVGIGRRDGANKDTITNIQERGEFVVNLVSDELAAAMNITAISFPYGHNELAAAGLGTSPSQKIDVPRISNSPVALECQLKQILDIEQSNQIVVAKVVSIYIRDDAVTNRERCHIDTRKLDIVGRMSSPGGYVRSDNTFSMRTMSFDDWQENSPPIGQPSATS